MISNAFAQKLRTIFAVILMVGGFALCGYNYYYLKVGILNIVSSFLLVSAGFLIQKTEKEIALIIVLIGVLMFVTAIIDF